MASIVYNGYKKAFETFQRRRFLTFQTFMASIVYNDYKKAFETFQRRRFLTFQTFQAFIRFISVHPAFKIVVVVVQMVWCGDKSDCVVQECFFLN